MATPHEQLEAMRHLVENWDGYGAAVPQGSIIDLAQEFVVLIQMVLKKQTGVPSTISVNPARDGGVLIEWQDLAKDHEIEMNPDGSLGFLHMEKATGHIETRRFAGNLPSVVPPGLIEELSQLLAA